MNNLQTIINLTLKNQGGTFNTQDLNKLQVKSGYCVAMQGYELQVTLQDFTIKTLQEYINTHKKVFLRYPEAKLGTWINENIVYIDISKIYTNKKTAIKIAKENKQLAIFDLKTLTEITINYKNNKIAM